MAMPLRRGEGRIIKEEKTFYSDGVSTATLSSRGGRVKALMTQPLKEVTFCFGFPKFIKILK